MWWAVVLFVNLHPVGVTLKLFLQCYVSQFLTSLTGSLKLAWVLRILDVQPYVCILRQVSLLV